MNSKVFMLSLGLMIVGCSSPNLKQEQMKLNATGFKQVEILGNVLDYIIVSETDGIRREQDNGLIEVYLVVKNITDTKKTFQYRFKWYDSQGFEVGEDMSIWKTKYIEGLSEEKIKNIAPVKEAHKYKCMLRSVQ